MKEDNREWKELEEKEKAKLKVKTEGRIGGEKKEWLFCCDVV